MDALSQMSMISQVQLENWNPDASFQINLDDFQNNNIINNNNSVLYDDLVSIDKGLCESVMNLTQCFICLSPAINPLACPKCNNFACQKCFDNYFENRISKGCPICKQLIKKGELKSSKIIKEIERIIYKDDKKENKIKKLTKLMKEKKLLWEDKGVYLKEVLNKLFNYQENLKEYKKEYEEYFLKWQKSIQKIFEIYENKVQSLISSLLNYLEGLKKKNKIQSNKEEDIANNKDSDEKIKTLVDKIVSMERNRFNEQNKEILISGALPKNLIDEVKKFLYKPFFLMPNIYNYNIITMEFEKKNFNKMTIKKKGYNAHIGDFEIKFKFKYDGIYHSLCQFSFDKNPKSFFFVAQKKIFDDKTCEIIPMKLVNINDNYVYETEVQFNELRDEEYSQIKMETKIQIFTLININ